MRRFTQNFVGLFARLMAASWLVQVMLPALCCYCYLGVGAATAYGGSEAFHAPTPCCCQTIFGRLGVADRNVAPHSAVECRGTACPPCETCGCLAGSDSRPSSLRRRQLEGSEKLLAKLVLPCQSDLLNCDSHRTVPSWTDACNKGIALSATERCVALQRLLL
jgi:hypothetical protein